MCRLSDKREAPLWSSADLRSLGSALSGAHGPDTAVVLAGHQAVERETYFGGTQKGTSCGLSFHLEIYFCFVFALLLAGVHAGCASFFCVFVCLCLCVGIVFPPDLMGNS